VENREVTPTQHHGSSSTQTSQGVWKAWFVRLAFLGSGEFQGWLISLFLVGFGLYELAKQELSIRLWAEAQGKVVESQTIWLERKSDSTGPSITVSIRYQYVVGDVQYESTRITTGEPVLFYDIHRAADFRRRYPPGTVVPVFYAPYAPSEATLLVGRSSGPWILLGFGVPCLLLVIYMRRRRRRLGVRPYPDVDIPVELS
jgi:hypothetical protein